jgi:hypothetical protein
VCDSDSTEGEDTVCVGGDVTAGGDMVCVIGDVTAGGDMMCVIVILLQATIQCV